MKRLLYLVIILPLMLSCSEEDLKQLIKKSLFSPEGTIASEETYLGKGTFAFTLDGEWIYQCSSSMKHYRAARYSADPENNKITIYTVPRNVFSEIYLYFSSDQLVQNTTFVPEAKLTYLFLPSIVEKKENEPIGKMVRKEEYRDVTIFESTLTINYCQDDIIAGRFTLKGEYADSTGKVHDVDIKDGIFDVTTSFSPKRWR